MNTVLIVDDNESSRFVLRGFLEDGGYRVIAEAESGKGVSTVCEELSPDVVIMDFNLPEIDGIEAAKTIMERSPRPVLLLTGMVDEDLVSRSVSAGIMSYLEKPIREKELFAAIEFALCHFKEATELSKENATLKDTIESRKVIEKAKGLLMKNDGISEDAAFTRLRKISMNKRKSMREIAEVVVLAHGFDESK